MSATARLDSQVRATAPIDGVGVSRATSPPTVRIDFRLEATSQQRADAQAIVDSFDWSDAAQQAWEENQKPDRKALRAAAAQALSDNTTYLAIATPSAAQVAVQVRRLTQQCSALIKRLIQID